jgi:hypothetical protein
MLDHVGDNVPAGFDLEICGTVVSRPRSGHGL